MSAQDHEGGGPPSGAPASGGAETSEGTPAPAQAGAEAPKVIASHGENATSAYVAAMPVPKRQRLKTVDMSKVRISADMKVEIADPRNMPTTRMEIPPGGLRPPPPPQAEVGDPASSPWSTTGGIDRSMLPSSSLGATSPGTGTPTSRPPAPASDEDEGARGFGVWIGVVVIAALLGGGAAYLLRGRVTTGSGPGVSSSAPIAIGVPGKTPTPAATPTATEPSSEEPSEPTETADGGAEPVGSGATGGSKGYVPRKTTTTKGTGTSTGTTAPTSTGTGPKRLFD